MLAYFKLRILLFTLQNQTDNESLVSIANKTLSRLCITCFNSDRPDSGIFKTFGHPIGKYITKNYIKKM